MARYDVPLVQFGSGSATVVVVSIDDNHTIRWRVHGVNEHPRDKRRKTVIHRVNIDDYLYRRMKTEERQAFEVAFFRSLLGEEVYREVLRQAWMMAMPEELKSSPTPDHHMKEE